MNPRYALHKRPLGLAIMAFLMLLAIGLPQLALAQSSGSSGSQFQFAPNDYFINVILKGILGDVINTGAANAQSTISGSGTLGEVFRTMNLGIAFFGSLMVIFITVVGILQSGNDGEFLGRKWSSMWVPVRFAAGSALMLPLTTAGYSYCQALVLWIAAQGVGFADTLWATIVSKIVVKNGAQISAAYDTNKILKSIAVFEACIKGVNTVNASSGGSEPMWARIGPVVTPTIGPDGKVVKTVTYNWGNPNAAVSGSDSTSQRAACGSISYSYPDAVASGAAGSDPYNGIRVAVDNFNRTNIEYYSAQYRANIDEVVAEWLKDTADSDPASKIKTLTDRIPLDVQAFNDKLAAEGTQAFANSGYATTAQTQMTNYGFAVAGMWYMDVLRAHNTLRQSFAAPEVASPNINTLMTTPVGQKVSDLMASLGGQMNSVSAGNTNPNAQINASSSGGTATAPVTTDVTSFTFSMSDMTSGNAFSALTAKLANYMRGVFFGVGASGAGSGGSTTYSSWTFQGNSSLNPNVSAIMQLKNKGDAILDAAGILVSLDLANRVINGVAKMTGISGFVVNTAADATGVGAAAKAEASVGGELSSYIVGAAGALFLLGMTLSILIPMMPYILWVGAILGLVILILESLVAIMIWAVMMMHPSGEGVTSQYNERGLQMLLAVFVRPALLLMGYVLGMFMLEPMVAFINDTFSVIMTSVQSNTFTGFFSFVAFIGIYVSLILMVVEKSFAMIHVVADRVLTWIGGVGALTGEESEAKSRGDNIMRGATQGLNTAVLANRMGKIGKR